MLYDLTNPIQIQKFKDRCESVLDRKILVDLTEKKKASNDQNRYLHLILTWFAIECGYTLDFVKRRYFKEIVNRELFKKEVVCRMTGEVVLSLKSTSELTMEEKALAITRFRNWSSSEADIYLPAPEDEDYLRQIMIEEQRHREYL